MKASRLPRRFNFEPGTSNFERRDAARHCVAHANVRWFAIVPDSYRFIGSFSAVLGRRLLDRLQSAGVRFECGLDTRFPPMTDFRHLASAVRIFVHEGDFEAANRILSEHGLKEGRDFFLLSDTAK